MFLQDADDNVNLSVVFVVKQARRNAVLLAAVLQAAMWSLFLASELFGL